MWDEITYQPNFGNIYVYATIILRSQPGMASIFGMMMYLDSLQNQLNFNGPVFIFQMYNNFYLSMMVQNYIVDNTVQWQW